MTVSVWCFSFPFLDPKNKQARSLPTNKRQFYLDQGKCMSRSRKVREWKERMKSRLSCRISMCHPNVVDGGTGEGTPFPNNLALFSILAAALHTDLVRKMPAASCKCEALKDVDVRSLYLKHLQSDLIWTFVLWLEELLHQNDPRTPKKAGVTSREKMSSYVADALIPRSTQHNSPPSRICHSLPKPPADCEKKDHTWQDDSNLLDLWLCFLVDFLASSEGDPKLSKVYRYIPNIEVYKYLKIRQHALLTFCWHVCARRVSTLNEEVVDVLSEGARGKTGNGRQTFFQNLVVKKLYIYCT